MPPSSPSGRPGAAEQPAEQLLAEVGEHRFLVGLAALGLLSEVTGEQPLVWVVDDGQWLGQASGQTPGFAARRLTAEPVGPVFGAREPGAELAGLPELAVAELGERHARASPDSALAGPLDARVRDQSESIPQAGILCCQMFMCQL